MQGATLPTSEIKAGRAGRCAGLCFVEESTEGLSFRSGQLSALSEKAES